MSNRRSKLRFTLRSLLTLGLVVSVPLIWFGGSLRRAERQRLAVEAIREAGGVVRYDWEMDNSGNVILTGKTRIQQWLMESQGRDFFSDVVGVEFIYPAQADDAVLERVGELPHLKLLILSGGQVTDAGLDHLKHLSELRMLVLEESQVTDAGLAHLDGLTSIEHLDLYYPQLTRSGLEHVRDLRNLKSLDLSDNEITDVDLDPVKRMKCLTSIDLWRTAVTDDGLHELRKALPHCEIAH
jgi:hypothetical protein